MSTLTPIRLAHIKHHQAAFDELRCEKNADIDAYFQQYAYIEDLYERVCDDLGLTPVSSTHFEGTGDGHKVRIQHCDYPRCDVYLGVNYPDAYCDKHKKEHTS